MRRPLLAAPLAAVALAGCASDRVIDREAEGLPAPAYEDVAAAYNQRPELLDVVWATGIVTFRYADAEGDRHADQGDVHFQLVQPDRFALAVQKLGEKLLWLGFNDERYWLFELMEEERVYVGAHDRYTLEKGAEQGLPATPVELVRLSGVEPLPTGDALAELVAPPNVAWAGAELVVELPKRIGVWRYYIDPDTNYPSRIELLPEPGAPPSVYSTLSNYEQVRVSGMGGYFPRMASKIVVEHPASESSMTLVLENMSDKQPRPAVFDFDRLVELLGPVEVVDLDERGGLAASP